jgi:peptidyl-prolyl cis-trans isomerase C
MLALLQDTSRAARSDQAEQQVYDDAIKQMKDEEEVHARHILVGTEEEAKAILGQLKGGADFTALAKEKSKDPTAAKNGGDLGYFTKDKMVPEFAKAAFMLDKDQISDPVRTQYGWHIIQVEDKRIKPTPTFAEMKPQIDVFIERRARDQLIDNLRKSATIEMLDKPAPSGSSANPASPEH